ncbi:MAG TPA: 2Fe-2S iron-sulfur cluster-binding protein [Candidatus Dormibacteraeota bacterium]
MPDQPPQDGVTLTIDGRSVTVPKGTLVVEAAKLLSIEVPVFCYHHKLNPVGACRLCLVEISPGPPKPQTACTTPVAEGMTVRTNTAGAVAARADILEYELVNHPLDCPVCDKGGECPLQDYTFRHGYPTSRIDAPRLHFEKPVPLSDKIALDRERCVLCYRCTRYYDEIAWEQELTTDQRGVSSFITNQFDRPLQSIFSGNIIDLCPVGALTSRVWRFESRPWDMDHTASVCSKCAVGCNVTMWQRRHQLVRVTSHENDAVDDGWICDRGRFDYTEVNSPDRLRAPRVKGAHATWNDALDALLDGVRGKKLGISVRQDLTNEEALLLKRLVDGPWAGARVVMPRRTRIPAAEGETLHIVELERARCIVVIASDTADDVPVVNLRIKKAVSKHGARLILVHPDDLDLDRWPHGVHHVRPGAGGYAEALRDLRDHEYLKEGPVAVLYGDAQGSEDGGAIAAAAAGLAQAVGGKLMPLYRATNERGALALSLLGEETDLEGCEAVLIIGPGAPPASARFTAVWDFLLRPEHGEPDVLLPSPTFAEQQGSYTNLEGRVQFLRPPLHVEPPLRESWDVLLDIGQRLDAGLDFLGIVQIQKAAAQAAPALAALAGPPAPAAAPTAVLYGPARP